MKEASKDKVNLYKKDFGDWYINNGKKLLDWYNYVLLFTEETLKSEGKIEEVKVENSSMILVSSDEKKLKAGAEIEKDAINICGLKNFLNDFSQIKDRNPEEVNLFEYYLIYANILGISEKVEEYLDKIYPNFFKEFKNIKVLINIDEENYLNIK